MIVKHCNRPAVGVHRLGYMEFIDVFYSFEHVLCLVRFPQVVQKLTLSEVETKTLI